MDKTKYAEITAKLVEAEKPVLDALKKYEDVVVDVVSKTEPKEMQTWFKMAEDDDSVSAELYKLAVDVFNGIYVHKFIKDIAREIFGDLFT